MTHPKQKAFFVLKDFFRAVLGLEKSWGESTDFPYTAVSSSFSYTIFSLLASCIHVVDLLQLKNQYWHVIIN